MKRAVIGWMILSLLLSAASCEDPKKDPADPVCGNGVLEQGEQCDFAAAGEPCSDYGMGEGTVLCDDQCRILFGGCQAAPVCGNGDVELGEQCDFGATGRPCADYDLGEGTARCDDQCQLDLTGCAVAPVCGDDVRSEGETCDGSDLGGLGCVNLGYDAGALTCDASCMVDATGCCRDACPSAGDARCDGDVVEVCGLSASGCLGWSADTSCAAMEPVQVCDSTQVGTAACAPPPCTDQCPQAGNERCAYGDSVVQTCTLQPDGCLDWSVSEDCTLLSSSGFCEDTGETVMCQACHDDCTTAGETDCVSDVLRRCVQVVPGCLEWQEVVDCTTLGPWMYCGRCQAPDPYTCFQGC